MAADRVQVGAAADAGRRSDRQSCAEPQVPPAAVLASHGYRRGRERFVGVGKRLVGDAQALRGATTSSAYWTAESAPGTGQAILRAAPVLSIQASTSAALTVRTAATSASAIL
jgi:hypothetical protein